MTKEEITVQRPTDVQLQKHRFSLICSGNALVTFAVWTIIRSIIQLYFYLQASPDVKNFTVWVVILIALVLGGVDLVLKLYVGLSARAEGYGKRKKSGYLILGILLAVVTVIWLIIQLPLASYYYRSDGLLHMLISLAVEATVLFAEVDLVVSALRVRRLEKEETGRVG